MHHKLLNVVDRLCAFLGAASMENMEEGAYYNIPSSPGKTVTAYYICKDRLFPNKCVFGLQNPNRILSWLYIDTNNYTGNTPQDLLAIRHPTDAVRIGDMPKQTGLEFDEMTRILCEREDKGRNDPVSMALKGLIDATIEQEAKIAALEKMIAKLSNSPAGSDAGGSSDTKRDLDAIKEWLRE